MGRDWWIATDGSQLVDHNWWITTCGLRLMHHDLWIMTDWSRLVDHDLWITTDRSRLADHDWWITTYGHALWIMTDGAGQKECRMTQDSRFGRKPSSQPSRTLGCGSATWPISTIRYVCTRSITEIIVTLWLTASDAAFGVFFMLGRSNRSLAC